MICILCGGEFEKKSSLKKTCSATCGARYRQISAKISWRRHAKKQFHDLLPLLKGLTPMEKKEMEGESAKYDPVNERYAKQMKPEEPEKEGVKLSDIAREQGRSYREVQLEDTWKKVKSELPPILEGVPAESEPDPKKEEPAEKLAVQEEPAATDPEPDKEESAECPDQVIITSPYVMVKAYMKDFAIYIGSDGEIVVRPRE